MKSFATLPMRILTHNIRYATTSPFKGEETWEIRMPRLLNELRFNTLYNPEAFICLQEVLHNQLQDIMSNLNSGPSPTLSPNSSYSSDEQLVRIPQPAAEAVGVSETGPGEWAYIGVGRDDGKEAGEYSPILYRPAIWSLQSFRTIWLSETPDRPSKGWDAASIRILTIGVFTHRQSRREIVAMNTHLDDQGSISRLQAAGMIVQQIDNVTANRAEGEGEGGRAGVRLPVFLAGDLNSEPYQEAYGVLNGTASPVSDAMEMAGNMVYGHVNTFTGFGYDEEPPKRIDFLFVGPHENEEVVWGVRAYAALENRFEDGVYDSDHRAVVGDFVLAV